MTPQDFTCLGDRERFAVEYALFPLGTEHLRFGWAFFWVGGACIGDPEDRMCLTDLMGDLKYPVGDCGNREGGTFCGLDPKQVFSRLHGALFEAFEPDRTVANEEMWARFDVSVGVAPLNSSRLYLIDCPRESRLIHGEFDVTQKRYVYRGVQVLERGEYDSVIGRFRDKLEDCHRADWWLSDPTRALTE